MTQLPGTDHFTSNEILRRNRFVILVVYLAVIVASIAWTAFSAIVLFFARGNSELPGGIQLYLEVVAFLVPLALFWLAALAIKSSLGSELSIGFLQADQEELRRMLAVSKSRLREIEDSLLADYEKRASYGSEQPREPRAEFRIDVNENRFAPQSQQQPPQRHDSQEKQLHQGSNFFDSERKISMQVLVRALNLPEDENDTEGFDALELVLDHDDIRRLLEYSQKVLTVLAHSDIFTDTLNPDLARPEIWRMHATGEKKQLISTLGGIRDLGLLKVVADLLESDREFYELALGFIACFQELLPKLILNSKDSDLADVTSTRTARAFILLGSALSGEY